MGATYTRQSSYADGDVITAAHTNDEFNQILAAFAAGTGHTHDGTAGEGGPITGLLSNTLSFGDGSTDADIVITFNANGNDGELKWMEDEDYFEFSDDILIASTEKLQFRDTAIYINSSADGQLDIIADTEIQIAATTIDINGNVDISGTLTIGGAGISEAELEILDGATVTTAELNILDGVTSTAAELNILDGVTATTAELNLIDGVTATTAEINIIDGDTSATSTTVVDADRVVLNDNGTMVQVAVTDLAAYFDDEITAMPNLVTTAATTVGALNSGSITSGFGTIDTGSSTITTTGLITGGALDIDDVVINGTTIGHTDDTDLITLASGSVTIAGDLTISGDDLTMGTNTAGHVLVGDDTNFNPVAISGDVTLSSSGAVTIANNAVETAMLNANVISGQSAETSLDTSNDTLLMFDNSASGLKKITLATLSSGLGGITDVVADTSPQLGGDLDAQGKDLEDVGISSADSHAGIYGSSSAPITITVTVASKTAAHPYNGDGSSNAYFLNGIEAPALNLHGVDNVTSDSGYYYKFDQADSSNSGHPLRFYLDADKTTAYTTGVTTNGTPGSSGAYTQIDVDEDTPSILYYQCSAHVLMGNHAIVLGSNKINHSEALISFPTATTTLIGTDTTDTLTNKTLTSPKVNEDVAVTATATELNIMDGVTSTTAELNLVDGSSAGTIANSKAVIYGSSGEVNATTLQVAGTSITSTAAELNLLDGSAKSTSSITIADADGFIVIDGTTTKQIPASDLKTYAAGSSASKGFATAMAIAL